MWFWRGATVVFSSAIARLIVLYYKPELAFTAEAFIVVKGIVSVKSGDEILRICGAAEPFESVIFVVLYFYIFDKSAGSHAAHGQSVDFIASANVGSTVANGYVAKNA